VVDNRSAGYFGVGGAFNFKSGDISGTAARMQDDKMGQGSEYFQQGQEEEEQNPKEAPFVDRSAQLRATLNSLAMMNVANVLNEKKRIEFVSKETTALAKKREENKHVLSEDKDEEFLDDFEDLEDDENEYY